MTFERGSYYYHFTSVQFIIDPFKQGSYRRDCSLLFPLRTSTSVYNNVSLNINFFLNLVGSSPIIHSFIFLDRNKFLIF